MEVQHIIEELQALAAAGTRVPGFRRKVLVDIDRLVGLGEELNSAIPADVQEAEEVIKQKESIIKEAGLEAQRIKSSAGQVATAVTEAAEQQHQLRVDESEIVRAAETRGEEIKEAATIEAQQIGHDAQRRAFQILTEADTVANTQREGANQYAREVLFSLEERLAELLGQVRRGIDTLRGDEAESQLIEEQVPA